MHYNYIFIIIYYTYNYISVYNYMCMYIFYYIMIYIIYSYVHCIYIAELAISKMQIILCIYTDQTVFSLVNDSGNSSTI